MPLPAFVGLASAAVPAISNIIQGVRQNRQIKNLKKSNFVPTALREKLERNRILAQATSQPGQSYALDQINTNLASGINQTSRATNNSADALNTVAALTAQSNRATEAMANQFAQQKQQQQRQLDYTETEVARQQAQNQQDYDQTRQGLVNARDNNFYNAATNIANLGAGFSDVSGLPGNQVPTQRNVIDVNRTSSNTGAPQGGSTSSTPQNPFVDTIDTSSFFQGVGDKLDRSFLGRQAAQNYNMKKRIAGVPAFRNAG